MSAIPSLSQAFLDDLADVYASLQPQALSAAFLSDLAQVHATLRDTSDANLPFLAKRFDEWRSVTRELVRTGLATLDRNTEPLLCPISLFRTMDYGRLETAHTRVLAWLLDPTREHGFGTTLLDTLLRSLPGYNCSSPLRVRRVASERPIAGVGAKGRLDVVAEGDWEGVQGSGWVLVIEAKVDAWEGEDQLQKYDKWLGTYAAGREVFRVFLTPDGRESDGNWEPLSFLRLVQIFRVAYSSLVERPGFHFLRFYLAGVLQDVCRWSRNIEEDTADPYAVASYLKSVHDSQSRGRER
jgi:hypothetical protein